MSYSKMPSNFLLLKIIGIKIDSKKRQQKLYFYFVRILSDHTLHGSMIINLRLLCKVFRQQNWSFFSERLARFPESLSRASVLVDMKTCWHFWKVGIWRKGCKGQGRYRREFKVIIVDQKLPTTVSESEIFHIYVWIKYKYSELHDLASGVVWEPLKILEQHFKIESLRIEPNWVIHVPGTQGVQSQIFTRIVWYLQFFC